MRLNLFVMISLKIMEGIEKTTLRATREVLAISKQGEESSLVFLISSIIENMVSSNLEWRNVGTTVRT